MANKTLFEDYDAFVKKFEPKKTTDDCYTPAPVYDVVVEWVREQVDISDCNIVRPFYPDGDYESYKYHENDVVIDNPPFSIISKIVRFYNSHGIRFFLFAPHLTLFGICAAKTKIVCHAPIIYENGAKVDTSFVSNMFGDDVEIMTASSLRARIIEVNKPATKSFPKYKYPDNVLTVSKLANLVSAGIDMYFPRKSIRLISGLHSQKSVHTGIYGSGYLLSDRIAEELAAKQAEARLLAAEADIIEFGLSEEELLTIKMLNGNE